MNPVSMLKKFFIDAVTIDNYVFRLHYKLTFTLLIFFACLVAFEQYIGDPINCISTTFIPHTKELNKLCWVQATYTTLEDWNRTVGEEVPYPGVGLHRWNETKIYHTYYQWVFLFLSLQAISFYIPGYFWKSMEGGKISHLTLGLNSAILPEDAKLSKRLKIAEYMLTNMSYHNFYFLFYAFAEVLNFVNVIFQIVIMNTFLGGEFLSNVVKFIEISEWGKLNRNDPLIKIFPRITKCQIYRYGLSGDVRSLDLMCVLPINNLNEKIFIFLWIWFVFLSVLSGLALLYRALIFIYPNSRLMVIRCRVRAANLGYLKAILNKCQFGDWFILDLLSKNMDPLCFRDVISNLALKLDESRDEIYLNEI